MSRGFDASFALTECVGVVLGGGNEREREKDVVL